MRTYQDETGLTGSINRARLTAAGGVATNFTWRIQGEFRTGSAGKGASVSLTDAFIRWKKKDFGVQAGQFKTPFSREYYTSLADLEPAERATVVDSLSPRRDIGVMADYDYRGKALLQVGVFNGEGQNVTSNKDSTLLGAARLVVRPFKGIAVGANVALYFSDSTRFGFDANYEGPRFTVRGETPSTSPVSSTVRPPKYRISTTRLCCGLSWARRIRASSTAKTSSRPPAVMPRSNPSRSMAMGAPRFAALRCRA